MGNVEKHRSTHEAFNRRDWDLAVRDFRSDTAYTDHARGVTVKGPAEFVDYLQGWVSAYSDAGIEDRRYIDGGDHTVCLFTGRGTNDGAMGPTPATGRRMEVAMCDVVRYGSSGAIDTVELYYDGLTIMVQLGLAEAPPV